MKTIYVLLAIMLTYANVYGQWDAHQLYEGKHYLNGGFNASMQGGKSRLCIPLYVPSGYNYIIIRTTVHANQRFDKVSMAQAAVGIVATGGLSTMSALETALNTTTGYGMVDLRLYAHPDCAQLFINKAYQECNASIASDNWGGGTLHFPIQSYSGTLYLCFRNPETMDGVPFYVEAIAVKELEPTQKTVKDTPPVQVEVSEDTLPAQNPPGQSYQFDKDKYNNKFNGSKKAGLY